MQGVVSATSREGIVNDAFTVRKRVLLVALCVALMFTTLVASAGCGKPTITLVTTRSTVNSGLLAALLPEFEEKYGIKVETVSATTCEKALEVAEAGGADVALTHSEAEEAEFIKNGHGLERADVMYSDYVLLGPPSDPAEVKTFDCPARSSKKIATMGITYVSRSDGSDLYKKELGYWQKNGFGDPTGNPWYIKTGKGMAETLRIADEKQGYVLSDMETYLRMKDSLSIIPIVKGCTMLFNRYGAIVVSPEKKNGEDPDSENARRFVTFITGEEGQELIASYRKYGTALFHPSADAETESGKM